VITTAVSRSKPTDLQRKYLKALKDGKQTGKQMRRRLRRWGVRGSNGAFYRVVQRLKRDDLIKSEHVRKTDGEYRGQEYYYELTAAGSDLAGPKLELLKSEHKRPVKNAFRRAIQRARACVGR
jgi:DNA-binding PadR family transcriptional regulator